MRLIRPIALAASFVLAILVFCCRGDNAFMLYFDLYGAMDELVSFFGVGALLSCFLMLFAPSESMRARAVWTVTSTLACLVGLAFALLYSPQHATSTAMICGALLGFGTIGLIGQWCCVFAQLTQRAIPFTIALSFFFGTLLWFILQVVNSFFVTCLALMVFSLCGGLLLALTLPVQRTLEQRRRDSAPSIRVYNANGGSAENVDDEPFYSSLTSDAAGENNGKATEQDKRIKVRPALILLDSFTMKSNSSVSWAHAFEALGAIGVSFFILGVLYWPDASDIVHSHALFKPLGYALASVMVFAVSARGAMSSLASGGMDRIRRTVILVATLLALLTVLLLPVTTDVPHALVRFASNFSLAVLMLFGFITSFIHILRHDPSPTFACAITVICGGIGLSLGIAAYILLNEYAYLAGALVGAVFLVVLIMITALNRE